MKLVKRWGVMTLVVLLVLGTMGAALADEPTTEPETTKKTANVGAYLDAYVWASQLTAIVHYWVGEGATCGEPEEITPSGMFFSPNPVPAEEDCTPPTLTGPNGQLNHGSMVSSFVHWLKDGGLEAALPDDSEFKDLPKGQLVKMFAHEDFGKKGSVDLEGSVEGVDDDGEDGDGEDGDGHGPPQWVEDKKAEKAADKAAKGKNK